jgi:TolB-like protein/class 3 adenylate cyclase/tetratricopeptide (TPR) repeat protein
MTSAARRLAAILAVDVAGYSRLMGEDEVGTARAVREHREAARPIVASHGGRIVKTMGDGLLLEFPSVVAAVECAIAVQRLMVERNADVPEGKRIVYRMGVHLGDVLIEDEDIVGEGVNIAARLEGVAKPGGICLSSSTFEHVRGRIDTNFIDLGDRELKNISRPIRVYAIDIGLNRAERGSDVISPKQSDPPRLSIVVLPFANFGGDPEQDYFVDGVTENLTTDLSRIRGSFVIARNTAFTFRGKPYDVKKIGRELNVRYALEGSVQRGGNRMRVNVQLIDTESGSHLWAERFDKSMADLFDMQDEIVARLADQIGVHLAVAEARRAEGTPSPDSMDLYFQAKMWLNKGVSNDNLVKARSYFERAMALDSNNLGAVHGVAQVDALMSVAYMVDDRLPRLATAEKTLASLLLLEPDNARFHFTMGLIQVFTNRALQGIAEYERALALDPNLAGAHAQIGNAKSILGRPEETEGHVREALRLSPRDTAAFGWAQFIGSAKLSLGSYEEAVTWFRRSIEINGGYPVVRFVLAAALTILGRLEEARTEVSAGLALDPQFSVRRFHAGSASDEPTYMRRREPIIDAMRKAGVPEG